MKESIRSSESVVASAGAQQARGYVIGLIGKGIGQSLSPAMHMAQGRRLGLNLAYRIIDADLPERRGSDAASLLEAARLAGFDGVNVTYPFKQAVMPLLDAIDPQAEALGAVNTVVFREGRATGYNTDAYGFACGIAREIGAIGGHRVLLLGAGGAGCAAAFALMDMGAGALVVCDVEPERAAALVARLRARYGDEAASAVATAVDAGVVDGLVNATPTGMDKFPGLPLDAGLVRPEMWVAEIVYFPLETELVALARARGCRVAHGGYMAVNQAARAFELFTGLAADADAMLADFRAMQEGRA